MLFLRFISGLCFYLQKSVHSREGRKWEGLVFARTLTCHIRLSTAFTIRSFIALPGNFFSFFSWNTLLRVDLSARTHLVLIDTESNISFQENGAIYRCMQCTVCRAGFQGGLRQALGRWHLLPQCLVLGST